MSIIFDNQKEKYPIVLIPDNILYLLNSEIDELKIASELNISKPQIDLSRKPEAPSKYTYEKRERTEIESNEHTGCLPLIFIASIVISIFLADSFIDSIKFILFGTLGYIAFFSFMLILNGEFFFKLKKRTDFIKVEISPNELKKIELKYSEKLKEYNENNEKKQQKYKEELKIYRLKIGSNKINIKNILYLKELRPLIDSSRGSLSLRRGAAELKFLEQLDAELKGLIFVDMVPRLNWHTGKNIYNPDFTLICNKTNLHIDIEIDEPYSMIEKNPIHYLGGSDESRNQFFLDNNWVIIRFTEKQIIQNTFECIKTIKSIYNSIIEMRPNYTTSLNFEVRWTYEESLILQKNRFRENYLNQ